MKKKGPAETVKEARRRLWDMIEGPQGWAFVSDADAAPGDEWSDLEALCNTSARYFQACANICRALARTCRKRAVDG